MSEDTLDPTLPGEGRPLARPGHPGALSVEAPTPGDVRWMARALERAREAALRGEVPVGALLVRQGRIIAEGGNRTRTHPDPTAHAEVEVIRKGARILGDWRLLGCTLYVTLEPCSQCAGSIVLARIPRLVFAAPDPKAGMVGSLGNLVQDRRLNHRVRVTAGVLAEPAALLLRDFFRERR
jgi:tRNA(adenine34) deaminase